LPSFSHGLSIEIDVKYQAAFQVHTPNLFKKKILANHLVFVCKELFHLQSMLDLSLCSTRPIFDNIPVKARILPGVKTFSNSVSVSITQEFFFLQLATIAKLLTIIKKLENKISNDPNRYISSKAVLQTVNSLLNGLQVSSWGKITVS